MREAAAEAMPPQALTAGPPAAIHIVPPTVAPKATSPLQSPLAELSPRFVCQADETADILMSPTKGQADSIAHDLNAPWRFADVVHQEETSEINGRFKLAPMTSVCLFVRPGADGHIEEVS